MIKKALLVGINDYFDDIESLDGCKKDAQDLADLLASSYSKDSRKPASNFLCDVVLSDTDKASITRSELKKRIIALFEDPETDVALFYFSGHGFENSLGGYLVTQDASSYEEGISFNDLISYANASKNKEIFIILDCCQSGLVGDFALAKSPFSNIRKGVSILTASNDKQASLDTQKGGLFTQVICDALRGGSADLFGKITLFGMYRYAERMFGCWDQRPTLKTNVDKSTVLRKVEPKIEEELFSRITEHFPSMDHKIQLDPSFEPTEKLGEIENEKQFSELQILANNGIVSPIGHEHMYYAAMKSLKCELTQLGQYYHQLISNEIPIY